jgi:ABC-2 type transport system ATP-binding protein
LLDLIRPTSGSTPVLGMDVHRDRLAIDRRVGYVPGEPSLYGDLTGRQLLTYLGNLQGSVDDVAAISGRVPSSIFQEG